MSHKIEWQLNEKVFNWKWMESVESTSCNLMCHKNYSAKMTNFGSIDAKKLG